MTFVSVMEFVSESKPDFAKVAVFVNEFDEINVVVDCKPFDKVNPPLQDIQSVSLTKPVPFVLAVPEKCWVRATDPDLGHDLEGLKKPKVCLEYPSVTLSLSVERTITVPVNKTDLDWTGDKERTFVKLNLVVKLKTLDIDIECVPLSDRLLE
jgi:hypothetical protein